MGQLQQQLLVKLYRTRAQMGRAGDNIPVSSYMHGDNGMSSSVFLLDHSLRMECSGECDIGGGDENPGNQIIF